MGLHPHSTVKSRTGRSLPPCLTCRVIFRKANSRFSLSTESLIEALHLSIFVIKDLHGKRAGSQNAVALLPPLDSGPNNYGKCTSLL